MGLGRIRPGSIASDVQVIIEEEPKTASPAAPFITGAKAIVPLLLALIPFGVAFGAFRSTLAIWVPGRTHVPTDP
jgi:hypothetical protein